MDRLAEHIRMKALDDHVFVSSRNGSVMRNRTFRRYWFDDAAEAIGIPGLTPHELRHTCASLAVSVGANVKAVQLMLGHASAAITLDVYADLFEDDLDDVGHALNEAATALARLAAHGEKAAMHLTHEAVSVHPSAAVAEIESDSQ